MLVQLESSASNASDAFWSRPIDKTVVGGSSVTRFPVPNTSFLRAISKPRIKPRSVIRYHVPPSPFAGLHGVVMTTSLKHLPNDFLSYLARVRTLHWIFTHVLFLYPFFIHFRYHNFYVSSWRVLDISVAMAYALLTNLGKAKRSLSAAAGMLRGFNSIYPLTDLETKHLRLLVASRLACSVSLGAYSHQQNPENEYLLLHSQPAWDALGMIWGLGKSGPMAKAIDSLFRVACTAQPPLVTNETIDCSDIAMPDPGVPDVLASVRTQVTSIGAGEGVDGDEPPAKKAKVDAAKNPIITFVTGNKKKLEEVKRILSANAGDGSGSGLPFELTNHKIDLPELQGDTLHIAKEKCALAAGKVGGAVITEDTSLCYNALKGLPGPYCKWFLDSTGLQGLNDMLAFTDDKSAYAQTVVAFCPGPGQEVVLFDGRTQGKIVSARGELAFGWDPVFEPTEGGGLTYAEMTKEGKDAISHRSRAFAQLRDFFHREEESVKKSILS